MVLRCREEVYIGSSCRSLVKLNHESKRRGKCVHETVVTLCEEGTSCLVESEIPRKRAFLFSFYLFMACSNAQ